MSSGRTTEEFQGLYDELGISNQLDGLEKIELLKKLECTWPAPQPKLVIHRNGSSRLHCSIWPFGVVLNPVCCCSHCEDNL